MGRTARPVATIGTLGSGSGATGGLPPPTGFRNRSSSYIDESREPPSFNGRPGSFLSISERIFPWHKLLSLTTIIAIVNVVMFIITLIVAANLYGGAFVKGNSQGGPSAEALRAMGGKWEPDIVSGDVWRLLTPIVLHAGLLHLFFNLLFLLRFGWVFEARWGMLQYGLVYLVAGVGGCILSTFASPHSVSVGASGALFGLLGADLAYLLYNYEHITGYFMEALIIIVVVAINIAVGFAGGGVDNYAHLGGLLFGFLAGGSIISPFVAGPKSTLWRASFGAALAIIGGVFLALIWILHK